VGAAYAIEGAATDPYVDTGAAYVGAATADPVVGITIAVDIAGEDCGKAGDSLLEQICNERPLVKST